MIWQCWLSRVFSEMKAQSYHPDREARAGTRSVRGFSECCPTTLHLHTDCRVCQLYFYGPAKPVSSKDNSNGHRAALNSKSHPLYSRKISAPEERHRHQRPPKQRLFSTSQLPDPGHQFPEATSSHLLTPGTQIAQEEVLSKKRPRSRSPTAHPLPPAPEDPSLRPLSADAYEAGKRQEETVTRLEERFMAERRQEKLEGRKEIRRSVSFAGHRRTYQY